MKYIIREEYLAGYKVYNAYPKNIVLRFFGGSIPGTMADTPIESEEKLRRIVRQVKDKSKIVKELEIN